jgi:hypothetical protein
VTICDYIGRDYPQRLMRAGFKVECIDFCNTFSQKEQKRLGSTRMMELFISVHKNDMPL